MMISVVQTNIINIYLAEATRLCPIAYFIRASAPNCNVVLMHSAVHGFD